MRPSSFHSTIALASSGSAQEQAIATRLCVQRGEDIGECRHPVPGNVAPCIAQAGVTYIVHQFDQLGPEIFNQLLSEVFNFSFRSNFSKSDIVHPPAEKDIPLPSSPPNTGVLFSETTNQQSSSEF